MAGQRNWIHGNSLGPACPDCLSDAPTTKPLGPQQRSSTVWGPQPSSVNSWTVQSCFAGDCLQLYLKVQLFAAVVKSVLVHVLVMRCVVDDTCVNEIL